MVGYGWPSVSCLLFRIENLHPPLCGNPSPHLIRDRIWKWWSENLTVSLTYLAAWAKDQRASTCELWFFYNCSEKQPRAVGFAWIWIGIGQGYPKPNTQRGASGRDNHQQKMKIYTTLQSKLTLSWTVFLSCVHQKITYQLFTMFLPDSAAR